MFQNLAPGSPAPGSSYPCCNSVGKERYGGTLITKLSGEPLLILPTDREAFRITTANLAPSDEWDVWQKRVRIRHGGMPC